MFFFYNTFVYYVIIIVVKYNTTFYRVCKLKLIQTFYNRENINQCYDYSLVLYWIFYPYFLKNKSTWVLTKKKRKQNYTLYFYRGITNINKRYLFSKQALVKSLQRAFCWWCLLETVCQIYECITQCINILKYLSAFFFLQIKFCPVKILISCYRENFLFFTYFLYKFVKF